MNVSKTIIKLLDFEDVDTVFSYMAEDNMELVASLYDQTLSSINLVHSRHEQGSMAMADGYARASDDIGVCIVGRGPAIAQTGTSLLTARKRGSKLLILVPDSPTSSSVDPKQFDQKEFLRSTVGTVVSVRNPESAIPKVSDALRRIQVESKPVAVQIPWDILESDITYGDDPSFQNVPGVNVPEKQHIQLYPDEEQIIRAIELYLDSDATKAPIIIAGRGAVQAEAQEAIEKLAERINAYLATTLQARGYFDDHPYSLGFVGSLGDRFANTHLSQSDFVIAIGCSLNPHTTDSGYLIDKDAKSVHIDSDPASIEQYTAVNLGIIGDARLTVKRLLKELKNREIDREGVFWTDDMRSQIDKKSPWSNCEFSSTPERIDPRVLVKCLDGMLPEDRIVVTDGGHFTRWVLDGITVQSSDKYIFSGDFAAVGQGLPMGIGAALADDNRTNITFCGDAGFMMTLQELDTAVRNDIPLIIIVINDEGLGSEYHDLSKKALDSDAAIIPSPDLAELATELGADGHTICSNRDLESIRNVISTRPQGPVLLDCRVDREISHPGMG